MLWVLFALRALRGIMAPSHNPCVGIVATNIFFLPQSVVSFGNKVV